MTNLPTAFLLCQPKQNIKRSHVSLHNDLQEAQRFTRRIAWKDLIDPQAEMNSDQFAEHIAEVGCHCQIALLVELFGLQARPAAINTSSPHWTSEHKHDIAVAVIG